VLRPILLHPCADGAGRFLTAELTGDYAGLLQLVVGKKNEWWRAPSTCFILSHDSGPAESYQG